MKPFQELARLDAVAQADLCARRDVSPRELWDACIARIEALNPLLHAVVTLNLDRPEPVGSGPLSGVPFLVKDATPWPGLRWSMGSRLFASNLASQQTPFGSRLSHAGLVCAGKTALSEFGLLGSTETLLDGITHNPWDLSHSAAGSSGGSAAAVAAGLVPLAHANDGGGSIRIPASVCGLFGFKPSRGRTEPASFGSSDFQNMTSDHCISRSVRDSALFLSITEGSDHCISRSVRDSALFLSITEDKSFGDPVGLVRDPISRKLRVAAWTRTAMGQEPTEAVRAAHNDVIGLLESLGHEVQVVAAPDYDGPSLAEAFFLVAGAAISDVVDMIDRMRGEPVQYKELEPFTWELVDAFREKGPGSLVVAREVFAKAVRIYQNTTKGYDVVLTPTLATEPWRIGHLSPVLPQCELIARTGRAVGYTPILNIAGCPAMSVPLTFPKDGLPIGAHFAAAPGADALLLGLAFQLEQARPWKDRWPRYSIPALDL